MILLRMFFNFGVEVLEVFEGFEGCFLQSFCSFESWCPLKCLRKASIYRSLGVGDRHVAESDWWHMSQPDWSAYVITYTRWIAYVIAYTCWIVCVITYTRWCVIWFLHDTRQPNNNTWCFVIGSVTCQLVIGREFSLSTNTLVVPHIFNWFSHYT